MARENSKLGLNPGRYREWYQSLGCAVWVRSEMFSLCFGFGNKMPNGLRFWFGFKKGKCI